MDKSSSNECIICIKIFVIVYFLKYSIANFITIDSLLHHAVVEMAERFAYYGVSGNLMSYLNNVLGMPISTAAKNVNVWHGVSAIFPLLGAFLADSYIGRFNTILFSSIIYLVVGLSVSATFSL